MIIKKSESIRYKMRCAAGLPFSGAPIRYKMRCAVGLPFSGAPSYALHPMEKHLEGSRPSHYWRILAELLSLQEVFERAGDSAPRPVLDDSALTLSL